MPFASIAAPAERPRPAGKQYATPVLAGCFAGRSIVVSRPVLKRFVVGGLLALALSFVPAAWAAGPRPASSPTIRPFTVYGVSTREQRSDLVSQGFDIGEAVWADHVMLYGSKA